MANTFKGYVNYGCLAAEKRPVFTAGNPEATASVSEPVEYTVPDGWEIGENVYGGVILTAPWGWTYDPNELIEGKEAPCLSGIDKDGNGFRKVMEWKKI